MHQCDSAVRDVVRRPAAHVACALRFGPADSGRPDFSGRADRDAPRLMQHPAIPRPPVLTSEASETRDVHGERPAREVPDAQLWRDAIGAARNAAAAVAELRSAFEAARPGERG